MILLLDVKMVDGVLEHKVLSEIDQATVDHLNSLFEFTSAYISSKVAKEIVYRNGERFKAFMKPENLCGFQRHMDDAILEANRHVYNYAASIKSFIDITQGFLNRDYDKATGDRYHDEIQVLTFDRSFEYAFFSKLRNYAIHVGFPYVHLSVSTGNVKVKCTAEHLLKWDGWTVIKKEIIKRGPELCIEEFVDKATVALLSIWIQYISIFYGQKVIDAITETEHFKREKGIAGNVGFAKVERREDIDKGYTMTQLPMKEAVECFQIMKNNPCVKLKFVQEE